MFDGVIGHEGPKALLRAAVARDRVAHAYLFYGEDAIGKRLMAVRFAQALNCEAAEAGCGTCRSCRQIESYTHPDALLIEPDREQANPQVKIEQIREIEQQIIYRPLIGRFKVVVIDEADRMTLGAANALLKTLEEPPAHSVFILISSKPFALPATITSRCQGLRFVPPARTQVEAALIVQRSLSPADAALLALYTQDRLGLALQTDITHLRQTQEEYRKLLAPATLRSVTAVFNAAEALAKSGRAPEAFDWIAQWLRDLLLISVGSDPDALLNRGSAPDLAETAERISQETLLELLTEVDAIQRSANRNVNPQLALETLLLRLRAAVFPPVAAAGPPA
ncbi:DNA polymerase III subunit delta' [Candidatus Nitrospira bockiana]